MEAGLLKYVCKHSLPKAQRCKRPENVSARAVHHWALLVGTPSTTLDKNTGIAALKALTCNISGEYSVRNVQTLFIDVDKIRKKYKVKTSKKEIIKWISYNIKPETVRKTVANLLKDHTALAKNSAASCIISMTCSWI